VFRRSGKSLKQSIAENKITVVFAVSYLILVLVIFFSPLLSIGWLDRLFILLLSSGSFFYCLRAYNDGLITPYLVGKRKYLLAVLLFYSAFAAVGNHLFLDPVVLNEPLSWLIFLLVLVWVTPIIISFLYLLEQLKVTAKRLKPGASNRSPIRVRLLFVSMIMLVGVIYLVAYNPAIMSPDSFSQWHQASGLEPLVNWHPPFHTLLIRALIMIMPSPSVVALAQIFFFALVFSATLLLFYQKGVNLKLLIILLLAFVLIPTNGIHLVTIWKDVPYAITLLWLTLIMIKVVFFDYGETKPLLLAAELAVSLVFVYFFRQNGIIVYVIYACFMALFLIHRRTLQPLAGVLLSIAIIILIRYPLYSYLQVEPAPPGNKYIALVNDLAGVYFAGGNLAPEAELYLGSIVDLEQLAPVYSEYRSNYDHYKPELDQTSMPQLLKIYSHTFVNNPLQMINSILCRLDLYWNIKTGKGAYIGVLNFREISNWEQFPIHFYRKNNALTAFFDLASKGTVYLSPALLLFWRFGIWLVLLFTGFLFALRHNLKIIIVLAVPILANLLSLALSSGWLDYRYGWSILITVPVIIGVMIMPWNRDAFNDLR
jgi:hypothetical protein